MSLLGCQIEHTDRLTPRACLALRFKWRGELTRIDATIIRSEMRSTGGKPSYVSGLEFCKSIDQSPAVIREVVEWLVESGVKSEILAEPPAPASEPPDDEPEVLDAPYLQCVYSGSEWTRFYVDDPKQPGEGFTIAAPSSDSEADVLCRAYQSANAEKRRAMRASFEFAIAHPREKK